MAYYRDPYFAAEPFEEASITWKRLGQAGRTGRNEASPEALKAFYADMEKKEIERKLSKRSSKSRGSMFKRKSVKRFPEPPPVPQQRPSPSPTPPNLADSDSVKDMESLEHSERADSVSALSAGRSIIPDPLRALPEWYSKDHNSAAAFRMRYPIYNPIGPRLYRNYHLIPPSELSRKARPPTFFSPSFPPMTTSNHDRSEDPTRLSPHSRTPSGSPSPVATPSSSQTRVADGAVNPRSRKTSQTAHDGVDLLDVPDPWGQNWHHQSPYDVGLGNSMVSAEVEAKNQIRSRRSSMTTRETRRKTITPSPLSQSTSAIHLQVPDMSDGTRVTRKLSKRRTPLWSVMFGGKKHESVSATNSPVEEPETYEDSSRPNPKRTSTVPAPKQARRGSVLGRLAKKFSVTRKSSEPPNQNPQDWQHAQHSEPEPLEHRQSLVQQRQPSPEKIQKRVPPPTVDIAELADEMANQRDPSVLTQGQDRGSYVSVEAPPFSIGRLTIANPDLPISEAGMTPSQGVHPLPPDKHGDLQSELSESPASPSMFSVMQSPLQVANPSPATPVPVDPSTLLLSHQIPNLRSPSPQPPAPIEKSPAPTPSRALSPDPRSSIGSPQPRQSFDDKPLPRPAPSERKSAQSSERQSRRRDPSPDMPPPPPSTTTKPKALPPQQAPSAVPFPAPQNPRKPPAQNYPQAAYIAAVISESDFNHSPLSTASMVVNPPTPQMPDAIAIAPSSAASEDPPPPPPRVPSKRSSRTNEPNKPAREPSPGVSPVTSRETETFKLVRSASGNVYSSTQTITASGEQWEVVEHMNSIANGNNAGESSQGRSAVKLSKRGSRDKERESRERKEKEKERVLKDMERELKEREKESRREQRRQEKEKAKAEKEEKSSRKQRGDETGGRSSSRRGNSFDENNHQRIAESSKQEEHKSSRSKEQKRERRSSKKASQPTTPPVEVNKPQPAPPPPTPGPSTQSLTRNPSTSARPTSEVPPAADLNALRAREMWEMERLYRARSMTDANAAAAIPPSPVSTAQGPAPNWQGGVHGSSHTHFAVQDSFSQDYPYSSAPQIYQSVPTSMYMQPRPISSSALSEEEIFSRPPNPLPAPPRQIASIPNELWTSTSYPVH
ncbi:hypothetical protein V5O48_003504 [Marasmius crinis-equi]|uniref:Uncharacterized protein n=1 Tax=Marasmius crinis-equi TaxID=585013 RepID=A0ABR3FTJ2_9AGAR